MRALPKGWYCGGVDRDVGVVQELFGDDYGWADCTIVSQSPAW